MEEIECLKYLYINLSMQRKTLKNKNTKNKASKRNNRILIN